jgi:peptide deformylase
MVLPITQYGHPVLRQKGARVGPITPELSRLIDDMFETMYDASGIGLAAQQVGHALQLTVLDLRAVEDRPSTLELEGRPADPNTLMPMVLVNPEIRPVGAPVAGPEGCLSFPEIYEDITRPAFVEVSATDREGRALSFKAGGLLARAIQHEVDHLNGILFIDRMTTAAKLDLKPELDELQAATRAALAKSAPRR